jgi:hypothetical protein
VGEEIESAMGAKLVCSGGQRRIILGGAKICQFRAIREAILRSMKQNSLDRGGKLEGPACIR